LTQVWPIVHSEAVDYVERTKSYPLSHRMSFKKGVPKKSKLCNEWTENSN